MEFGWRMGNLFNKLLYSEIPEDIDYSWLYPIIIVWGIATQGLLFSLIFLFGSWDAFMRAYAHIETEFGQDYKVLFLSVTIFATVFRSYFCVTSITKFKVTMKRDFDNRYSAFVVSGIVTQNIAMLGLYLLVALALLATGYSFSNDSSVIEFRVFVEYYRSIIDQVPTLFDLGYWPTLVVTYLVYSFFAYWLHRLGHESRALWLLSHRPHHYSTTLHAGTTVEADAPFVLGLISKLIIAFVASLLVKLVYDDSYVFIELVMYQMVIGTVNFFNHSDVHYDCLRNNKWLYPFIRFTGVGPFHYLHHSSAPEYSKVNIAGEFWCFWDRIFGTYAEPPKAIPKIGLTNQPEMYMNPVSFAFSGLLQMLYELRHNRSFLVRLKIIFGGVYYMPPLTKSYLKKPVT
tara:strand:- start:5044 stop:6246 length:1203 start_codon:yes stop_codon:yes gene_type:complete